MRGKIEKTFEISPKFPINTILNGLWQLSGGHGQIDLGDALSAMQYYHSAGLISWDLADHYGFAEDLVGMFQTKHPELKNNPSTSPKFFTKWVPPPGRMTRKIVENAINRSLRRMNVDSLDMLQFHWWDYSDENYLVALNILDDMRKEGKIKYLSLTNFDTEHLHRIVENGIPITSNQIQFSILDQRPLVKMVPFCKNNNIKLFAYGTLGGGLFTERFHNQPSPSNTQLNTSSLQKYYEIIGRWGNWEQFQHLLAVIHDISDKHNVSMANVAVRYVLEQAAVTGAIIGTRLSLSEHIQDTMKVFTFILDHEDHQRIRKAYEIGNNLFESIGDCGDEYR